MSGHLRARLDGFLRSQDNYSVFIGSGEKHSLAFHAAELGGLQIGDHNDLPAHEFFRRVMISDTCAYLALFGSQVDLEHQQPIGVGMRLGGFDSCHSEFHIVKFINGDHPNLIYRACCLLQEDSRTCSSKKDFGVSGFHASLDNQKQRTIRLGRWNGLKGYENLQLALPWSATRCLRFARERLRKLFGSHFANTSARSSRSDQGPL